MTSLKGEEITYALHFDFHTASNKAEYEALLAGIRLAKQMVVEAVVALTDIRLSANQINGEFETKDKRMEKYVKVVQEFVQLLREFTIKQILRGENRRADPVSI